MNIEIKEEILNRLKENKSFKRASLNQYCMRCTICGDSKKDPSKRRLYFKIDTTDDSPIMYHCFNCDSSGILTSDMLRTLNIYDMTLGGKLTRFNKESAAKAYKRYNIKDKKLNVKVPIPKYTKRNMLKKAYIEKRLGITLTFAELFKLKTVFSLNDFLVTNKIDTLTVGADRVGRINDEYVGFLTMNNEFINFRDITNGNKMRYDKYTILPDPIDPIKMYTIPTSLSVLTSDEITINFAEGVFDILGIYYNIMDKSTKNMIYVAVCGSGYMNAIKHFIQLGFIGKNITINIFSDSDRDPYFYKKVIEHIKPWVGKVNLIYNTIEKDYGVPKDKISLRYANA